VGGKHVQVGAGIGLDQRGGTDLQRGRIGGEFSRLISGELACRQPGGHRAQPRSDSYGCGRAAARHADVVGLSGLGRTLADGHHHQVRWSGSDLRRQLRLVGQEAELAGTAPVIEALVQEVTVTGDRAAGIQEIAGRIPGASAADIASTPFLLIGSYEQMAAQLLAQAGEYGITRYVVREPAIPHIERVLALLSM
jgi:hypothetical protein